MKKKKPVILAIGTTEKLTLQVAQENRQFRNEKRINVWFSDTRDGSYISSFDLDKYREKEFVKEFLQLAKSMTMHNELISVLKTAKFMFKKEYGFKKGAEPTMGSRWYKKVEQLLKQADKQ